MKCLFGDAIVLAVSGIVLVSSYVWPPGLSGMQDPPVQSSVYVPLAPPLMPHLLPMTNGEATDGIWGSSAIARLIDFYGQREPAGNRLDLQHSSSGCSTRSDADRR